MYRLDPRSVWRHLAAERARYEKPRQAKAKAARAADADADADAGPARLLCQSKLRSFDTIYRLALAECGVGMGDQRRFKSKPSPYESVARELRLITSQAGLAVSCGCDVRTLQRHLDDLQALGLIKVRQQMGQNRFGSPSFQLVLRADFLDWSVLPANPATFPLAEETPVAPASTLVPAGAPDAQPYSAQALTALEMLAIVRERLTRLQKR